VTRPVTWSGRPSTRPVEVVVRAAQPADAFLLRRWRAEPAVRRFQPLQNVSVARLRAELSSQRPKDLYRGRGDRYTWMIETDGQRAGWITLAIVNWEHGLGELGYALGTRFHGHGTMTAALSQLLPDLLFRTSLQRLEARCSIDNGASRRVLEKLGFVCEGTLRSYFVLQGRRTDHYLYALLREDYIPVAGDV